ncbi:MAG TPA: hypothetical protein VGY57_00375, partial [Vicinamibacterales bacterium]|nr:hypothetical protein [Vicinamibacterales bacterium]
TGSAGDARATLERADRTFMADAARLPLADVYKRARASDGRVYRDGVMPMVGASAERWYAASPERRMTGESLNAEAARSGDLGFTYGRYTLTGGDEAERGHYVRVWTRARSGQWKLALDVNAPRP